MLNYINCLYYVEMPRRGVSTKAFHDDWYEFKITGQIALQELEFTQIIRPYINLETWIVMPNHIHAIIEIVETPRRGVSTTWKSGTLGAIINQYKSVCTKRIRALDYIDFAWQPRFYDHIIWNKKELENIHAYILGNPTQWAEDEYFSNFSKL